MVYRTLELFLWSPGVIPKKDRKEMGIEGGGGKAGKEEGKKGKRKERGDPEPSTGALGPDLREGKRIPHKMYTCLPSGFLQTTLKVRTVYCQPTDRWPVQYRELDHQEERITSKQAVVYMNISEIC